MVHRGWGLLTVFLLLGSAVAMADELEFVSGSKVQGQVVARDESTITFSTTISGRSYTRKYPISRIRALTVDGKREEFQPAAESSSPEGKTLSSQGGSSQAPAGKGRSRAAVEKLIDETGRTPPDWWESTPLDYPQSLDLSWPEQPQGWNNQRNVGQYVWDIINPNPGKWKQGLRLMHYMLSYHKDDARKRDRAMRQLAQMYQNLLQDYARAAFWWRRAGVDREGDYAALQLAECYWKLGNKQMALETMQNSPPTFSMIKLWADMGETQTALRMADANLRGSAADVACIYAGDACRVAGRYQDALKYYERVLSIPVSGQWQRRIQRNRQRAQANIEGIKLFDTLDLARVPDGTYRSSSLGYEAPVHVEVVVKQGRIESVRVTEHHEKQFYSAMTDTPAKIIAKQGVKGIDATSSATMTSEAILNATAKALSAAMQ